MKIKRYVVQRQFGPRQRFKDLVRLEPGLSKPSAQWAFSRSVQRMSQPENTSPEVALRLVGPDGEVLELVDLVAERAKRREQQ